jgi:putative SOS response-associated peptidase YedK
MCFNMSLVKEKWALEEEFSALFEEISDANLKRWEASGFTHPIWPILPAEKPKQAQEARWGLIPHWVKKLEQAEKIENMTLNARSETIWDLPSFRSSAPKKRCLIPVDGFFEPHAYNGRSYPFYLHMKNHIPFALAGLYADWAHPDTGAPLRTFTVITRPAAGLLKEIHNKKERMPVIIGRQHYETWLDRDRSRQEIDALFGEQAAAASGSLHAHPVSPLVYARSAARNVPEVQQEHRFGIPEIDDLGRTLFSDDALKGRGRFV